MLTDTVNNSATNTARLSELTTLRQRYPVSQATHTSGDMCAGRLAYTRTSASGSGPKSKRSTRSSRSFMNLHGTMRKSQTQELAWGPHLTADWVTAPKSLDLAIHPGASSMPYNLVHPH
jgi:hypothetical protein